MSTFATAAKVKSSKEGIVDSWVRLFQVSDPRRHHKGHTVYKVTSTVFPRNAPEASTQVCVWRRFRDFKRLHKTLLALHANLHLSGTFPTFPKERLFGRFEPQVIEERRKSASELLEFVALHSPLFTSQAFVRFFENSGKYENSVDSRKSDADDEVILKPIKAKTQTAAIFGGVWLFKRSKEDVSSAADTTSEDDDGDDEHDYCSDKTTTNGDLALLSLFDPLFPCPSKVLTVDESDMPERAERKWLTTALESDRIRSGENTNCVNFSMPFPKAFADFDDDGEDDYVGRITKDSPIHSSGLQRSTAGVKGDATLEAQTLTAEAVHRNDHGMRFLDGLLDDPTDRNQRNDLDDAGSTEDYLVDSAEILKRAQESEIRGHFEAAFALYKTAIEVLLSGVKEDLDFARREAVKRKTAIYLRRAEDIYDNYLIKTSASSGRIDNVPIVHRMPKSTMLKSPIAELSRYKVLGVIDQVLLVFDALANATCVIKVVPKSSKFGDGLGEVEPDVSLPDASHVVRLLAYYETKDAVFLVMEHATGGRLWNYMGASLQTTSTSNLDAVADPFELPKVSNVYEGKKYLAPDVHLNAVDDHSLLDTDELVSKSRRLLKHVDVTLALVDATKCSDSRSPTHGVNHRRHSDQQVDGLEQQPRKRSSSSNGGGGTGGGSLELQQTRVRHFSSVFKAMDSCGDGGGRRRLFDEASVRVWGAEIAAALMDLHSFGVVCRDLKPANVLLDERGHVLLSYFARLPGVDDAQLDVRAKEAFYVAPELLGVETTRGSPPSCADWFSFGGLLFVMLTGRTLSSCHPGGLWSLSTLHVPCSLSIEAESILRELLRPNPRERLGGGPEGDAAVREHPFFADVDWSELLRNNEQVT